MLPPLFVVVFVATLIAVSDFNVAFNGVIWVVVAFLVLFEVFSPPAFVVAGAGAGILTRSLFGVQFMPPKLLKTPPIALVETTVE